VGVLEAVRGKNLSKEAHIRRLEDKIPKKTRDNLKKKKKKRGKESHQFPELGYVLSQCGERMKSIDGALLAKITGSSKISKIRVAQ